MALAAVEEPATDNNLEAANTEGAMRKTVATKLTSPAGLAERGREVDTPLEPANRVGDTEAAAAGAGPGRRGITSQKSKGASKGGKAEEVLGEGRREATPFPGDSPPGPNVSCFTDANSCPSPKNVPNRYR